MILFDSSLEDSDPKTPRVPVPHVVRIPIEWDVEDILNDLEPPTYRGWKL